MIKCSLPITDFQYTGTKGESNDLTSNGVSMKEAVEELQERLKISFLAKVFTIDRYLPKLYIS